MFEKLKQFLSSKYLFIKTYLEDSKKTVQSLFLNIKKNQSVFLTVMFLPHDEKKPIKVFISYKKFFVFSFLVLLFLFFSTVILLQQSSKFYSLEEIKLSSEDYALLEKKMKLEMTELHLETSYFYEKIFSLYSKLGGTNLVYQNSESQTLNDLIRNKTDILDETFTMKSDIYNLTRSIELTKEIIKKIKIRKEVIKNTPSLWPVKGYVLFPYGKFFSPLHGKEIENQGIDIGTFAGSEVIATAPGEIYEIGYTDYHGYYLKILHNFGWKTIYSNLERLQVKKGDKVSKGQILGYVGKTIGSSIFRLHYEVHVGTKSLNPYSFLNQIQN